MADPFAYTFGVEEEFFLTHPKSRSLASSIPRSLLRSAVRSFGNSVAPELHHAQIELVSPVFSSHAEGVAEMRRLRKGLAEIAMEKDLRLMASGTHPIASWDRSTQTPKARYRALVEEYQIVGRRNVVCGLHVHVAIPPGVDRVELMNRAIPWLPAFLALSTSSPFWLRQPTGLYSYRQAAYDEWPRTGIPDAFDNEAQYARFVELLVAGGAIKDASYLWWAIRPALRYPTLELRICDACTRVEDALAIASLYRCLLRHLVDDPGSAPPWTPFTRRLVDENRWRVKRFGLDAEFVTRDASPPRPCREVIGAMLDWLADDARALDCVEGLDRVRQIIAEGTSAHCQLAIFEARRSKGDSVASALHNVVDWLVATTYGLPPPSAPERSGA